MKSQIQILYVKSIVTDQLDFGITKQIVHTYKSVDVLWSHYAQNVSVFKYISGVNNDHISGSTL